MNLESIRPRVCHLLKAWPGYEVIRGAMANWRDCRIFLAGGVGRNCALENSIQPKDFDFFIDGASIDAFLEELV